MQKEKKNNYNNQSDFGMEDDYDFNQYGYAYHDKPLTKGQKLAVGVLAFFSFLLIIFQFANFKDSINKPFEYKENSDVVNENSSCSGPNCPTTIANLKAQDTDGDGINDYDELNVYKTSPYLDDSDSDGFSDFEEIKNGKDPNCPAGRDCSKADPLANITAENNGNLDIEHFQESFIQDNQGNASSKISENLENIDAVTLRALLLENGIEKEILDQISDENLLNTFRDVLKKMINFK